MMSDEVLIALIAAAGFIVSAVLNGMSNYHAHRKLDHIILLTNSTLTNAILRIDRLEREIQRLGGNIHP